MAVLYKHRLGERMYTAAGPDHPEPARTRDILGCEVEQCSFCGEPRAAAYWHGAGPLVRTCRRCAVSCLPALVADALVGERPEREGVIRELQHSLTEFHAAFWRAAAIAADRRRPTQP